MDKPKVQVKPPESTKATPITIIEKLADIQAKLKAPKSQYNSFSKFNYRNCEDILEALKPLLGPEWVIIIEDQIIQVGERYYVKATALITNGKDRVESSAYARESLDKKGMDDAQITGATSSYARKYALNGLLAIDDAKDADAHDNRNQSLPPRPATPPPQPQSRPQQYNPAQPVQPKPTVYKASEKQLKFMATLCTQTGIDREKLKQEYKVTSAKELTPSQASQIINMLMKLPKLPPKAPAQPAIGTPPIGSPAAANQEKPMEAIPPKTDEALTIGQIIGSKLLTPEQKAEELKKRLGGNVTTADKLPIDGKK